jgi:hypothetical protein
MIYLEPAVARVKMVRTMAKRLVTSAGPVVMSNRKLALRSGLLPMVMAGWTFSTTPARAQHACDAPTEAGWRVIATNEVAGVRDGRPFQEGMDWVVERTTTLLPFCNYIDPLGSYSLRSYSLEPMQKHERITLCRGVSTVISLPVAPYFGPCPPQLTPENTNKSKG